MHKKVQLFFVNDLYEINSFFFLRVYIVHPNIFFTGTLPKSSKGEQLLAQFATCIVNKMALHSMGRIQMALWIPDQLLNVNNYYYII